MTIVMHSNTCGLYYKSFTIVMTVASGLYYKSFTIVIYDRNDSTIKLS